MKETDLEFLPPDVPLTKQPYDKRDAEATIIDELTPKAKFKGFFLWIFWWFLELLPTYYKWQEKDDNGQWVWHSQFRQVTHPLFRILAVVLIEYHHIIMVVYQLTGAGGIWARDE